VIINPGIYEAVIALVIGISGISLGLRLGIRHILLLLPVALGAGVALRVTTALGLWSLELNHLNLEVWAAASLLMALAGGLSWWRQRKLAFSTLGLWAGFVIVALTAKYVLGIGEMQHTDSAAQFAVSLLVIQSDTDDLSVLADSPKLGIAFPLMLALGPGGRIFSLFPFLVFLSTLSLIAWLTFRITRNLPRKMLYTAWVVVGLFSLTIPMFRISAFYVNSHTLMGLGIALLATGIFLTLESENPNTTPIALISMGALIGSTARIEGIILVGVLIAILASQIRPSWRSRLAVALGTLVAGGSLSWWTGALDSPVIDEFGLEWWWLPVLTAAGAALLGSPLIDGLRRFIPYVVVAVLLLLLGREVWTSSNPFATATAQVPNLIFGEGGWASAAIAFVILTLLSIRASLSKDYLWFLRVSWLGIATILFSKTFDGGFGRESFYDSVNRMILHIAPLILIATIVAFTEMFERSRTRPSAVEVRTLP
jgi:hypothetical protein